MKQVHEYERDKKRKAAQIFTLYPRDSCGVLSVSLQG